MNLDELKNMFFIDKNLAEKKEKYLESEVEEQEIILRIYFKILKRINQESEVGKKYSHDRKVQQLKYTATSDVNDIFDEAIKPSLSDFYKRETMEYVLQHKDEMKKHVIRYIENNTKFQSKEIFHYTENKNKNMDEILIDALQIISSIEFVNSEKFNDIREKIKNNALSIEDADYLTDLVIKQIDSAKREKTVYSDIKSNLDSVCKIFIKHVKKSVVESKTKLKEKIADNLLTSYKYKQGQTLQNPFFSNDKENNYEIYINQLMSMLDEDTANRFASLAMECDKTKEINLIKPSLKQSLPILKNDTVEADYKNRLSSLIEYMHMHSELDRFIATHNSKMDKMGINELKMDLESLKSTIENIDVNSRDSFEVLVGLSAFYSNRMSKLVAKYGRISYILNKYNAFEKLAEDDDFEFEDIEITEEDLRTYMAEYDILSEVVNKETKSVYKDKSLLYSDPDKAIKETEARIRDKSSNFTEIDGIDFESDIELVYNSSVISGFYEMKNEGIKELAYIALTDPKSSIINWGYIKGDRNDDNSRILIGFDIRSLNMPLFFHIDRETMLEFVQNVTGDSRIPVYKGEKDMDTGFDNITTQVAYPLSKAKKKEIKKATAVSYAKKFLSHIQWMQDGKNVPEHLKDVPDETYDIKTGSIQLAQSIDFNSDEVPDDDIDL